MNEAPSDPALRAIIDSVPCGILVADEAARLGFVNAAACRLLGRSSQDLVGQDLSTLLGGSVPPLPTATETPVSLTDAPDGAADVHVPTRDGVFLHAIVFRLADGHIVLHIEPAGQDVRILERQRFVAEVSSDLVYEWNVATDALEWFGDVDRALGYEPDEIPRTVSGWFELLHPENRADMTWAIDQQRTSTEPTSFLYRIRRKDGSWRWWEDNGVPVLGPDGQPERWIGACRDISERRQAEEALRLRESEFRTAFEASVDAIFWADPETGLIIQCNQAAERLLEMDRSEIVGMHQSRLHPPEHAEHYVEVFREHVENFGAYADEAEILTASGTRKPVMISASVPIVGDRAIVQGLFRDLTEAKRAERERRELEQRVQQAQRMQSLGVLAGGIAHDFNNLLTAMLGGIELASLEIDNRRALLEHLATVKKTTLQAADLCRQLLAYSGKGKCLVEPVSLTNVVRDMTELIQVSLSKRATLRLDLCENLPQAEADVTQVRQIVLNLVLNASEAIADREGTISVGTGVRHCDRDFLSSTWLHDDPAPGEYVYFEVSDTGQGMDEETRANIFDPFFTTKFTGRGLGLAATLGIVRSHRGAIKVRSEPGQGTAFQILFPVASDQTVKGADPARDHDPDWQGRGTILVVDDEEIVRDILRSLLRRMGFDVLLAADGDQALETYAAYRDQIRLVILDLIMPRLSGEETFHELRALNPKVRVLLVSGYDQHEAVRRFAGQDLDGFAQKPLGFDDLRDRLRAILEA